MSKRRPRLLDLFCGAGGAGMGYHRAGFDVVGVDIKPQKHYPFEFIQADALEYLAAHGHEFDAIHASPPCERFSRLTPRAYRNNHLDLIGVTRDLLLSFGKPYIIENVPDARKLLQEPIMLCGSMFGLRLERHRYFEMPWYQKLSPFTCRHEPGPVLISGTTRRKTGRFEYPVEVCRAASGIDWMTRNELDKAIPPAYTGWIGRALVLHLQEMEITR